MPRRGAPNGKPCGHACGSGWRREDARVQRGAMGPGVVRGSWRAAVNQPGVTASGASMPIRSVSLPVRTRIVMRMRDARVIRPTPSPLARKAPLPAWRSARLGSDPFPVLPSGMARTSRRGWRLRLHRGAAWLRRMRVRMVAPMTGMTQERGPAGLDARRLRVSLTGTADTTSAAAFAGTGIEIGLPATVDAVTNRLRGVRGSGGANDSPASATRGACIAAGSQAGARPAGAAARGTRRLRPEDEPEDRESTVADGIAAVPAAE